MQLFMYYFIALAVIIVGYLVYTGVSHDRWVNSVLKGEQPKPPPTYYAWPPPRRARPIDSYTESINDRKNLPMRMARAVATNPIIRHLEMCYNQGQLSREEAYQLMVVILNERNEELAHDMCTMLQNYPPTPISPRA
jgi:hypothetical protein